MKTESDVKLTTKGVKCPTYCSNEWYNHAQAFIATWRTEDCCALTTSPACADHTPGSFVYIKAI